MPVDWKEVNDRRISEKTQEILLYCSQKKSSMTPRAFDLARISFEQLLDNIAERNPKSYPIVEGVRRGLKTQEEVVAVCSEKQAAALARGVVYNYMVDDLNLYPITAAQKILRAKTRDLIECDIPIDEMTVNDIIYVASVLAGDVKLSKATARAVFSWFNNVGLNAVEARVFSYLYQEPAPISIKALPQYGILGSEYREAANSLVEKGYIREVQDDVYSVAEKSII